MTDLIAKAELPLWLKEILPEPKKTQLLTINKQNKFELTQPTGESVTYESLKEVYEASKEISNELEIDESVCALNDPGFLSYPSDSYPGYTIGVFSSSDKDRLRDLEFGYESAKNAAEAYSKNTDDFVSSWDFVNLHPIFWRASDVKSDPFVWDQASGVERVDVNVWREASTPLVLLEAGSHCPPTYDHYYFDPLLSAKAASYEEAIIKLAKNIHTFYDTSGAERKPLQA